MPGRPPSVAPRARPARRALLAALAGIGLAGAGLAAAARPVQAQQAREARRAAPDTAALLGAARAFMDGYAGDLRRGDRAAIAARYDRAGTWSLGNGQKAFDAHAAIVARYAGAGWRPPASFDWRDLSYEVLGPDAVLVVGLFDWGTGAGRPPVRASYTAVLRRHPEGLRIRVEDESVDSRVLAAPAPAPAPRDSTRP